MTSSSPLVLIKTSILVSPLLLLSACGGGGGSDSNAGNSSPTNNLKAESLQLNTSDVQIGYPIELDVTVSADEDAEDVNISLFAVEKKEDSEAEADQYPLGGETYETISAGTTTYQLSVDITSSVAVEGDYYITAVIDPADLLSETDEEDNAFAIEYRLEFPDAPNVYLDQVALDRASLEISTASYEEQVDLLDGNVYNPDASASIDVGVDGIEEGETLDVEAFALLRLSRSDTGTSHDVPLYLWNSDLERYTNAYGVDPETELSTDVEWLPLGEFAPLLVESSDEETTQDGNNLNSTLMNFYFPGKLGSTLEYEMRYGHIVLSGSLSSTPTTPPPDLTASAINALTDFLDDLPTNNIDGDENDAMAVMDFEICVQVRPSDESITDSIDSDNELCAPLAITLPPLDGDLPDLSGLGSYSPQFTTPTAAIETNKGYITKAGGSYFSFGLDFGTTQSADYRGYIEEHHAAIPVTIFGESSDFMRIGIRAQLVPEYPNKPADAESELTMEFYYTGLLLDSTVVLPTDVSISADFLSIDYSKQFPTPPKEITTWLGPVPVSWGGSAGGNFGVSYEPLNLIAEAPNNYEFGPSGGPYANLEMSVYGALGSNLAGFAAGIEGVLTLLDERIVFFNGVYITVVSDDEDYSEFIINQGPKITNVFSGPQGKINLYAQYSVPAIKTCKAGILKFPCPGFKKLKVTKNIWSSKKAFELTDVLYENPSLQLDVVVPDDSEPLYFAP